MRSGDDFRLAIRRGSRGSQPTVVTHVLLKPVTSRTGGHTSVGFVVSKAVGSAVERNRVKRRLRHLMRERIDRLPAGSHVVVRALPPSGAAGSVELGHHLDVALTRAGAW